MLLNRYSCDDIDMIAGLEEAEEIDNVPTDNAAFQYVQSSQFLGERAPKAKSFD